MRINIAIISVRERESRFVQSYWAEQHLPVKPARAISLAWLLKRHERIEREEKNTHSKALFLSLSMSLYRELVNASYLDSGTKGLKIRGEW